MIQPEEIKKQAMRWYPDVLAAAVAGSPFFPKDIRFGKVKASETLSGYSRIKEGISELSSGSRERLGYGYSVEFVARKDRKTGEQRFPERIWFADEHDYLRFIGKKREYDEFRSDSALILDAIPALRPWLLVNPLVVVEHAGAWRDLLAVCGFFLANPRPYLYIRELPLELPTKFVEEHKAVLRQLLDQLIPESINQAVPNFEQRYNLKYDEPLIRMRILDSDVAARHFSGLRDLSIPQSEFNSLNPECTTVLILENKTSFSNIYNFLALPGLEQTIALFGKGFQLSLLKEAAWLRDKRIIYWGDIDLHGFQILSQLRSYFPQTESVMMDRETFEEFKSYRVDGAESRAAVPLNLEAEEKDLYEHLLTLAEKNRLEQEKISHCSAVRKLLASFDQCDVADFDSEMFLNPKFAIKKIHVACAIIEQDGRVLATQRSAAMSMPLKWEFPGGKIKPGETPVECLRREVREELGIEIEVGAPLQSVLHQYPDFQVTLYPFICSIISGEITLHEHAALVWLLPVELPGLDWAEADLPILEEYGRMKSGSC